jgi:uncharacterized phage protein gp47/JayE
MNYGASLNGFRRKTENEILVSLQERAKLPDFFGTEVDLSPYSPIGIIISLIAKSIAENWEALEANYYSAYLDTATGIGLDRLGGIPRKLASKEKVKIVATGQKYTEIPSGFLIQTLSGIVFQTVESKVILETTVEIQAEAIITGIASRVIENSLTEIVTPIAGLDSITNPEISSGGSIAESDAEYRARIFDYIDLIKSSGSLPYMKIMLEEKSYINSAFIRENTLPAIQDNMPANSIEFTILGGTNQEVAETIYALKPAAVKTLGNISISVSTGYGDTQVIKFYRPTYVDIYAKVQINVDSNIWTSANVQLIKTAIVKYIGGVDTYLVNSENVITEYSGLGIGKNVVSWQAFNNIINIGGIINLTLLFGKTYLNRINTMILIGNKEIPRIVTSNIEVLLI